MFWFEVKNTWYYYCIVIDFVTITNDVVIAFKIMKIARFGARS